MTVMMQRVTRASYTLGLHLVYLQLSEDIRLFHFQPGDALLGPG